MKNKIEKIEKPMIEEKISRDENTTVDVNIIRYFCRNGNNWALPNWIADAFDPSMAVSHVITRLTDLCNDNIVECENKNAKGRGGGLKEAYKLILSVENLKILVSQLQYEDIFYLMKLPQYTELLPSVLENFERTVENQKLKTLRDDEREYIKQVLKLSPQSLIFALREDELKNEIEIYEELVIEDSIKKIELLKRTINSIKSEVETENIIRKEAKEKIWYYVFNYLELGDRMNEKVKLKRSP